MEMIGKEFLDRFHHYIHQWWPARALLEKAISKRFDVDFHKKRKKSHYLLIFYIFRLIHPVQYLFSIVHFHGVNIYLILNNNKKIFLVIQLNMFFILIRIKLGVYKLYH
jgi:hypothetical protein